MTDSKSTDSLLNFYFLLSKLVEKMKSDFYWLSKNLDCLQSLALMCIDFGI